MTRIPSRVISACIFVILTACSTQSTPSTSIQVALTDFAFTPNTFAVPAGQEIQFAATNTGAVTHSFVIMQLGHDVSGHFTSEDRPHVYWEEPEVAPGQSVQGRFVAPTEPGDYQIVCANGGHFEAGMVARLIVVGQPPQ